MRIKSDSEIVSHIRGLGFDDATSEIIFRTEALSVNPQKQDIEKLMKFSGSKSQESFVFTMLAQYYQYVSSEIDMAIKMWTKVLNYDCEERIEALINLSTCHSKSNNYPDAFCCIEMAKAIPTKRRVKTIISNIEKDLNEKARTQELNLILSIEKLVASGDFGAALLECDNLKSFNKNSKTAHFKKAHIYGIMGEPELARAEFLKSK